MGLVVSWKQLQSHPNLQHNRKKDLYDVWRAEIRWPVFSI